jgi:hypothetical protein
MNAQRASNKVNAFGTAMRTFLLFFCVLFSLRSLILLCHEAGHALPDLIDGNVIDVLYAHPFTFAGLALAVSDDRVITSAAGPVMAVLVPLLIFILLWKHRSVALLPLVMVFPWVAALRTEPVTLKWRNLRIPAVLAAVSVILGILIIA